MITILYSSVIAFCVSVGVMPTVAKVSRQLGAVSDTGGRHVGEVPIGRLGGIGVLLGWLVALLIQYWINESFRLAVIKYKIQFFGILISLMTVAIVGFWDDVCRLSANVKFSVQILSALLLYWCGVRVSAVDLPLLESFELGWFSLPVTILWIVGIINAINLIDGLDGLAGGVLLFASMLNLVVAVVSNEIITAVLMSSVVGAVLGFLRFNWYPAKIYLGDGGAYSLGFLIAISGLISPMHKVTTGIAIVVPVLAAGLPIIDTILVVIRRIVTRRGVFSPDRGHLHHVLLDSGISHKRVVVGLYFVCCLFCSIALLFVLHRNRSLGWFLVGLSFTGIIFWGFGVKRQLGQALIKFTVMLSKPKKYLNGGGEK
jgi:UDP-GlcNAc:undecaprenyl-phosphate GlcNAc-1-phosphate transferase